MNEMNNANHHSQKDIIISSCVIVKNEEKTLPSWLHCAKIIADEIVVIDTGSTDKTVEIAQAAGARVLHFTWTGSFAEAKNCAIDNAHGHWIVFLDADETFSDEDAARVREWILAHDADMDVEAMVCPRLEMDADTGAYKGVSMYDRVFRNGRGIRYDGNIHEILRKRDGQKPKSVFMKEFTIRHTGYSSSVVLSKIARNLGMILSEQDRRGEEPMDAAYLADCWFGLGQYAEAAEAAQKFIVSGYNLVGMEKRVRFVLIQSLVELGRWDEAWDALEHAKAEFGDVPDFYVQGGLARYRYGDYVCAESELRRGLAIYEKATAADPMGTIDVMMMMDDVKKCLEEISAARDTSDAREESERGGAGDTRDGEASPLAQAVRSGDVMMAAAIACDDERALCNLGRYAERHVGVRSGDMALLVPSRFNELY
ncbi:MAG: glycosyltransferase [Selenomonadaceae bacterium]